MLRVWLIALGPALFAAAGLVGVASEASAQPPNPGRGVEKKNFEGKDGPPRKDGERKDVERKDGDLPA